jgi:hypothetical protein
MNRLLIGLIACDGVAEIEVTAQGRYFEAAGVKDGRSRKYDRLITGQLIEDDND